jgi:two-component system chemotaxis family response regulator WspR
MDAEAVSGATRVLVVDDSAVVRRLLARALRGAGCRVSEGADGAAALVGFRRSPAEVVVTDVSMPRLDGLKLLAALRAEEPAPEVVLLTACGDGAAAIEALRLGAHDYIPKTAAATEAVVLAVRRAAEKWRLRQDNLRLVAELQRMALTDGLTGVGNRRAFDEALHQEVARARRQGASLALAMLDLDHFKAVNDRLGHPAGDEVLAAFAARLRSVTRDSDRLFRYGGEEFALLVGGDVAAALVAAERIVRAIREEPFPTGAGLVGVTCSAGVSVLGPEDGGGAGLVARADAALYAAKRRGRDRVVPFDELPLTAARRLGEATC